MQQGHRTTEADRFVEAIELLEARAIEFETACSAGRANLYAVIAALDKGHPCLQGPLLFGRGAEVFLTLAREALGTSEFLRARHATVHPRLLSRFVSMMLYPTPTPEQMSDEDLRFVKKQFAEANYTIGARADWILAKRITQRAVERRVA